MEGVIFGEATLSAAGDSNTLSSSSSKVSRLTAAWKLFCRDDRLRILTAAATAAASSFTSMRDNLAENNEDLGKTTD